MIQFYLNIIETPEQRTLFELMYHEYKGMMYAKAHNILKDSHLAEDAVHAAFVNIAENFERIQNKLIPADKKAVIISEKNIKDFCPNIGGYLIIVVKNVCLAMLNNSSRSRTVFTDSDELIESRGTALYANAGTEDENQGEETVEAIIDAIKSLGDTYRDALYMHVVLGMDAREISESLGCGYENARKRIQRGRKELREILGNNGRV